MNDAALWDTLQAGAIALGAPLFLVAAAIAAWLCDISGPNSMLKRMTGTVAMLGVLGGAIIALKQAGEVAATAETKLDAAATTTPFWGGGVLIDGFGLGVNLIICIAALLTLLLSGKYLAERQLPRGEFFALILFASAGAMIMAQAADLVNLFVGLEVLSVALYILAGFAKRDWRSEESAVKYFLLGAFASGFLLYGIALVYGAAGIAASQMQVQVGHSLTNLGTISDLLTRTANTSHPLVTMPLFVFGVAFILVGLGFKAAIAPFHSYAPDVYEGAPAPVAAYMSAAAKLGAFAGLIRLMQPILAQGESASLFRVALWILALLTMLVGNIMAVRQTSVKRMLAYSSIAHAGYILVGVLAGSVKDGALAADAVLFYLFAYTLMNIGAFALTVWLGGNGEEQAQISQFSGLAKRHPLAAGVLTIFLLSLSGIPPTAGFLGKLYLFLGAFKAGFVGLAVAGLLISAIGLLYYLNLVVKMYFEDGEGAPEPVRADARMAAVLAAIATVAFGFKPLGLLTPKVTAAPAITAPVASESGGAAPTESHSH
ncbi:MAG: NADH-quinone oxidoreductase subunit N [Armatimonas sp.]